MEGLQQTEGRGDEQWVCEFSQAAKISHPEKISRQKTTPQSTQHLQNGKLKIVRK